MSQLKLIMFDLDGTLVNSKLDFDLMRKELCIENGNPILEEIIKESNIERKEQMLQVVHRHELEGVARSTLFPGVKELLAEIDRLGFHKGLLTRNSSHCTKLTLEKHQLNFELVMAREDVNKPKPDPEGLHMARDYFKVRSDESIYVGDFKIDLIAAKNAGMKSLYIGDIDEYKVLADASMPSINKFHKNFPKVISELLKFSL